VTLVDDLSTDGTGDIARTLRPDQVPLTVLRGSEPPEGWAGKVWAMQQGVAEAGSPEYLLFTDADIALAPGTVAALVRAAQHGGLDLVSQMARLRTETTWERAIIPAFVYFFGLLYPFRRVNRPRGRTAAAAGGCMLVRREALEEAGGLERIRGALIDDVALGRLLKHRPGGGGVWLGHGAAVVSVRAYPRRSDLWTMVARSAFTQLRHSWALLSATVIGLVLVFEVPPVGAIAGVVSLMAGGSTAAVLAAAGGLAAWTIMAVTFVPTLRMYGLRPFRAFSLPAVALLYLAMTVDSAIRYARGRGGAWKGRTRSTMVA
jgi:hopene-associated glycosyltransferase HpnB